MMVQVASIPHNGTHFLRNLLKENGVTVDVSGHLRSEYPEDWDDIICPMRPPRDVAFSWSKRRRDYGWDVMYERVKELDAHFLFIEDQELALSRLAEHLGKDLTTDWKPLNHSEELSIPFITEDQILFAEEIYSGIRRQTCH